MSSHNWYEQKFQEAWEAGEIQVEWEAPPIYRAPDFDAAHWPEETMLLGPLVRARQRTILAGQTGAGKTTMCGWMIKALACAETFLAWKGRAEPARVLWLDLEQSYGTMQERLREVGLHQAPEVELSMIPDGLELVPDGPLAARQREWLFQAITQRRSDVVVVDPFYKLHAADSLEERAMLDLLRLLDRWRMDLGFAVVLLMHLRKGDPRVEAPTINDIFGSSGIVRGAEVCLGLQLLSPGYSRLHFWKDRSGVLPVSTAWTLRFDRERGYATTQGSPEGGADDAVIRCLAEVSPSTLSSRQIAAATGLAERTVRDVVKRLEDSPAYEVIIRPGPGKARFYGLASVAETERWEQLAAEERQEPI